MFNDELLENISTRRSLLSENYEESHFLLWDLLVYFFSTLHAPASVISFSHQSPFLWAPLGSPALGRDLAAPVRDNMPYPDTCLISILLDHMLPKPAPCGVVFIHVVLKSVVYMCSLTPSVSRFQKNLRSSGFTYWSPIPPSSSICSSITILTIIIRRAEITVVVIFFSDSSVWIIIETWCLNLTIAW